MSVLSNQPVGMSVTNNAFISKLSYASDAAYEAAQTTYLVPFPDVTRAHVYYNTTLKQYRYHDGVSWSTLGGGANVSEGTSYPAAPKTGDLFIYTGSILVAAVAPNPALYPNKIYYFDGTNWFEFEKQKGMTVLGQSSGQVFTNGVTGIIKWNIQNNFFGGCLNAVGGGVYTPTKYGKYQISMGINFQGAAIVDYTIGIRPYVNGVAQRNIGAVQDRRGASVAARMSVNGSDIYLLSPSDQLDLRLIQSSGANRALIASVNENWATITYLGV